MSGRLLNMNLGWGDSSTLPYIAPARCTHPSSLPTTPAIPTPAIPTTFSSLRLTASCRGAEHQPRHRPAATGQGDVPHCGVPGAADTLCWGALSLRQGAAGTLRGASPP